MLPTGVSNDQISVKVVKVIQPTRVDDYISRFVITVSRDENIIPNLFLINDNDSC